MTKDFVKQLRIKSNAIKTCRFWQRHVTNLLFNSIYTLHSNSLPPSIPDILSAFPPRATRGSVIHVFLVDILLILARYILQVR